MKSTWHLARGAVIAISLAISVMPLIPPAVPEGRDARAFSTTRAIDLVERIAQEPRPIGSAENVRVRTMIANELRNLGLDPQFQAVQTPDYYGATDATVSVVNVIAWIDGLDSTGAITVVGHYDSVPTTTGANDNATAVAIILDLARVLASGPALRNDVILLFTDGEEPAPRYGSSAFVENHPWFADVGFIINLEAIGTGGPSLLIETNGSSGWIMGHYAAVPHPAAFSFMDATTRLLGGSNTDFAPFRDAGVPGLELAYLGGSSVYHTERDIVAAVSERSLHQQGANTLALVRRLGAVDLQTAEGESANVFFTIGPRVVVRLGAGWLMAAVVVSGVALFWVAWKNRSALGWSVADTLVGLMAAALAISLVWIPMATWRSTMGITEGYLYLFAIIGLACTGLAVSRRRWRRSPSAVGVVLVWWTFAAALLPLAPGLAYLFVGPASAASVMMAWWAARHGRLRSWEQLFGFAVVSLIAMVAMVPAVDFYFQLAQPRPGNTDSQILWVIALPVMLIVLAFELIAAVWTLDRRGPRAGSASPGSVPSAHLSRPVPR